MGKPVSNRDGLPGRNEEKKNYHEGAKARRHEDAKRFEKSSFAAP